MTSSSSSLVDNLPKINSQKYRDKNRKSESVFKAVKKKLSYNCKKCRKEQLKTTNGLIKKFSNTYKFCNAGVNKFILLLRKGVYPYGFVDSWERFNEVSLSEKEAFFSELNLKGISDEDYIHAKKVFKEFKLKTSANIMTFILKVMCSS